MTDPKNDAFLDEIADVEAEQLEELEELSALDGAEVEIEPLDLEQQIDELIAERDAYKDKFMRALADAENVRKRSQKDRREAENYGGSRLSRDILPVYDNLQRALEAAEKLEGDEHAALIEGVKLTSRELLSVFSKHGVTKITPEIGDIFDPQLHEAMFEAPVPGTKEGEIIQVSSEGFMLHDRLLRPAQVGVSSTPAG